MSGKIALSEEVTAHDPINPPSDIWRIISDNVQYPAQHVLISQICTSSRVVYGDAAVWQKLCHRLGIGRPVGDERSWKEIYIRVLAHRETCRFGSCFRLGVPAMNTIGDLLDSPTKLRQHFTIFYKLQYDVMQAKRQAAANAARVEAQEQAQAEGDADGEDVAGVAQSEDSANDNNAFFAAYGGLDHEAYDHEAILSNGAQYLEDSEADENEQDSTHGGDGDQGDDDDGSETGEGEGHADLGGLLGGPMPPVPANGPGYGAIWGGMNLPAYAFAPAVAVAGGAGPMMPAGAGPVGLAMAPGPEAGGAGPGGAGAMAVQPGGLLMPMPLIAMPAGFMNALNAMGPPGAGGAGMGGLQALLGLAPVQAPGPATGAAPTAIARCRSGVAPAAPAPAAGPGGAGSNVALTTAAASNNASSAPVNTGVVDDAAAPSLNTATFNSEDTAAGAVSANTFRPAGFGNLTEDTASDDDEARVEEALAAGLVGPAVTASNLAATGYDQPIGSPSMDVDSPGTGNEAASDAAANAIAAATPGASFLSGVTATATADTGSAQVAAPANIATATSSQAAVPTAAAPSWMSTDAAALAGAPAPPAAPGTVPSVTLPAVPASSYNTGQGPAAGNKKIKGKGRVDPAPVCEPEVFPLSHEHWRNVPAAPETSYHLMHGGHVTMRPFLNEAVQETGGNTVHSRLGDRDGSWTGWSEKHEKEATDGYKVREHEITKCAFASNPPLTTIYVKIGPFETRIFNIAGVTNLDIITQVKAYLWQRLPVHERKRIFAEHAQQIQAVLKRNKATEEDIESRMDLLAATDRPRRCGCNACRSALLGSLTLDEKKGRAILYLDMH